MEVPWYYKVIKINQIKNLINFKMTEEISKKFSLQQFLVVFSSEDKFYKFRYLGYEKLKKYNAF